MLPREEGSSGNAFFTRKAPIVYRRRLSMSSTSDVSNVSPLDCTFTHSVIRWNALSSSLKYRVYAPESGSGAISASVISGTSAAISMVSSSSCDVREKGACAPSVVAAALGSGRFLRGFAIAGEHPLDVDAGIDELSPDLLVLLQSRDHRFLLREPDLLALSDTLRLGRKELLTGVGGGLSDLDHPLHHPLLRGVADIGEILRDLLDRTALDNLGVDRALLGHVLVLDARDVDHRVDGPDRLRQRLLGAAVLERILHRFVLDAERRSVLVFLRLNLLLERSGLCLKFEVPGSRLGHTLELIDIAVELGIELLHLGLDHAHLIVGRLHERVARIASG